MHSLRSGDIDVLQWIDNANLIYNKLTLTSRELFLKKSNEDIANNLRGAVDQAVDQVLNSTATIKLGSD